VTSLAPRMNKVCRNYTKTGRFENRNGVLSDFCLNCDYSWAAHVALDPSLKDRDTGTSVRATLARVLRRIVQRLVAACTP
jgi:hypothetical protein